MAHENDLQPFNGWEKNLTLKFLDDCIWSAWALATGAMHTVQPKNSFINHYGKKTIFEQKFNAIYIHSREIETLLKTSAKHPPNKVRC